LAMDRAIPAGSKICAKREERRRHEQHKQRIQGVRPMVDTSLPPGAFMDHVRSNLKREQLLEERYSEIDRENRILLKKMATIMTSPSPNVPKRPLVAERPSPGPTSLNRETRRKELLKITQENQQILKRIQKAQPSYNHVEMEGNHRRHMGYLRNCAEYPLVLRTPRSARGPARGLRTSELVPLTEEDDTRPRSARSPPAAAEPPASAWRPRAFDVPPADLRPLSSGSDADDFYVSRLGLASSGSVIAEVDFGSTIGDAQVRVRGLTPSHGPGSPM